MAIDRTRVFIPVTGDIGFGDTSTAIPSSAALAAPGYAVPVGVRKLGLVKKDGGPEWKGEPSGDAIDFWQEGEDMPSGEVDAELTFTLAQTDPIVREFTSGKVPDANGVIDVDLGGNTNRYWLYVEEVAKNLDIRRRVLPNCTVKSVKEDKSERGTPLGYQVTIKISRSALIGMAHYREAVLTGLTAATSKTSWTSRVTGTPTGGTYRLVLNGAPTANLAYAAVAADIAAALNALSGVTGLTGITASGTGTITITLPTAGSLTAGSVALTGGATPGVTVA